MLSPFEKYCFAGTFKYIYFISTQAALTSLRVEFNRSISVEKLSFVCPENVRRDEYFICNLTSEIADEINGKVNWGTQSSQSFNFPSIF